MRRNMQKTSQNSTTADINDKQLIISMNQDEYNWLAFDRENMKITGLPTVSGVYNLTFTAIDKSLNKTEDKIKITVRK